MQSNKQNVEYTTFNLPSLTFNVPWLVTKLAIILPSWIWLTLSYDTLPLVWLYNTLATDELDISISPVFEIPPLTDKSLIVTSAVAVELMKYNLESLILDVPWL